jgi:hypothetical protein
MLYILRTIKTLWQSEKGPMMFSKMSSGKQTKTSTLEERIITVRLSIYKIATKQTHNPSSTLELAASSRMQVRTPSKSRG